MLRSTTLRRGKGETALGGEQFSDLKADAVLVSGSGGLFASDHPISTSDSYKLAVLG